MYYIKIFYKFDMKIKVDKHDFGYLLFIFGIMIIFSNIYRIYIKFQKIQNIFLEVKSWLSIF